MDELVFGPVPSRRLGKSIGVNNIPHKVCSYSCLYCQVGKRDKIQIERQGFYSPDIIVKQVEQKLNSIKHEDFPNYITVVPDGEPTLDIKLGKLIANLKTFGLPVAVITNSSLVHLDDVTKDLSSADYISFKVDTVNHNTWKHINKPHKKLFLNDNLNALIAFKQDYKGILVTETMLVKEVNDSDEELTATAQFLQQLKPNISYISVPTRPPAFQGTLPANEENLLKAHEIFYWHCLNAEYLTGYEGNAFASSGNFIDDLLSITAVHPMRKDAVKELMNKTNTGIEVLHQLIQNRQIIEAEYERQLFYVRSFKH